jgi:hypothetical protein
MSEEKQVSYTAIEQALWDFRKLCIKTELENSSKPAMNVYYAISWYVGTARASTEWIRLFINLPDPRLSTLIKRALSATDTSIEGMIQVINKYLGFGKTDAA